jgi:hypothetical protein
VFNLLLSYRFPAAVILFSVPTAGIARGANILVNDSKAFSACCDQIKVPELGIGAAHNPRSHPLARRLDNEPLRR